MTAGNRVPHAAAAPEAGFRQLCFRALPRCLWETWQLLPSAFSHDASVIQCLFLVPSLSSIFCPPYTELLYIKPTETFCQLQNKGLFVSLKKKHAFSSQSAGPWEPTVFFTRVPGSELHQGAHTHCAWCPRSADGSWPGAETARRQLSHACTSAARTAWHQLPSGLA